MRKLAQNFHMFYLDFCIVTRLESKCVHSLFLFNPIEHYIKMNKTTTVFFITHTLLRIGIMDISISRGILLLKGAIQNA